MKNKKWSKESRRAKILELLDLRGAVEVSELSRLFGISDMSIRNDLNYLAQEGRLNRKYGGANISRINTAETPLTEKQKGSYYEKSLIGKAAAKLIDNGDSIMLDAGTTTEHLARHITQREDLTVITNGVNLITLLMSYPRINLYTVGGRVDGRSFSIIGEEAVKDYGQYVATLSFLTIDGLSLEQGLTNNSFEATNLSRVLLTNSRTKVLLADAGKIGRIGIIPLCPLREIDILITDARIPEEFRLKAQQAGVEVIVAEESFGTDAEEEASDE